MSAPKTEAFVLRASDDRIIENVSRLLGISYNEAFETLMVAFHRGVSARGNHADRKRLITTGDSVDIALDTMAAFRKYREVKNIRSQNAMAILDVLHLALDRMTPDQAKEFLTGGRT